MLRSTFLLILFTFSAMSNTFSQGYWEQVGRPFDRFANVLSISPAGDIYANGDSGLFVYPSSNGPGEEWTWFENFDSGDSFTDILVPSSKDIFVSTGGMMDSGEGIICSHDGGESWGQYFDLSQGCAHIYGLAMDSGGRVIAYDHFGSIYRFSPDSVQDPRDPEKQTCWPCIADSETFEDVGGWSDDQIDFLDIEIGHGGEYLLCTNWGLMLSEDEGVSWTDLGLKKAVQCVLPYKDQGYMVGTADKGIFIYNCVTDTWSEKGMSGIEIISLGSDGGNVFYAANPDSGVYLLRTNIGGAWKQMSPGLEDAVLGSMVMNNSKQLYVGTDKGVFRWTSVVGVKQDQNPGLRIYPNPARNFLFVELLNQQLTQILISTLNGRVVLDRVAEGTIQRVDLSSFPGGVYFITVRTEDGVSTRKIVRL